MAELRTSSLRVSILVCVFIISGLQCMQQEVWPSCELTDEVCEFFWTIDYMWTMNYYDQDTKVMKPVVLRNGSFFLNDCDSLIPVDNNTLDSVVTADGRYTLIYAINNEFPGPNIVVFENQTVVVHVTNHLVNEGVSIHWHGIPQEGTPWMDGVSSISQYTINKGETFTYRFHARPRGTFWYHAHHGTLRTLGIAGALIILPTEDTRDAILDELENEYIAMVTDWYVDQTVVERYTLQANSASQYQSDFNGSCESDTATGLEGIPVSLQLFESALINGRGWLFNDDKEPIIPELPLEKYEVSWNRLYKFRIINTASSNAFRFSIDQHELTVIAADAFDIEPITVESVIIYPAERYDILVTSDQFPQSYWIRAETLAERQENGSLTTPDYTLGILYYTEADYSLPTSERQECDSFEPCVILGCPYSQEVNEILGLNRQCIHVSEMRSTASSLSRNPVPIPEPGEEINEIFLNFHFQDSDSTKAAINGRKFIDPPFALQVGGNLSQIVECEDSDCEVACDCTQILRLEKDSIVQLILTGQDSFPVSIAHPIHIHGTEFHVIKAAFPTYDSTTGLISEPSPDIVASEFYTSISWANADWYGDNIPGLNLENPPIKDTISIPSKGYTVLRFRATNPGYWFVHCHFQEHNILGMALVLQVGELEEMPDLPDDYPFRITRDALEIINAANESTDGIYQYAIVVSVFCGLFVVISIIQCICLMKRPSGRRVGGYKYIPNKAHLADEKSSLIENSYKQ